MAKTVAEELAEAKANKARLQAEIDRVKARTALQDAETARLKATNEGFVGDDKNVRKTEKSDVKKDVNNQIVDLSGESNIFNRYRSITYSFTLASLEKRHLDDPESYRKDDFDLSLIILKSGGKGDAMMKRTASTKDSDVNPALNPKTEEKPGTASDKKKSRSERRLAANNSGQTTNDFFAGFNTQSPGRFDMFMENVDIESLMAPSQKTNTTTATKIKFDVIEPYSINGFIEALHTASVAAGYPSYQNAAFLLKLEFWGYPDEDDFPDPVKIPTSTRYYPMSITEANIEITEKGTLYRCNAVPYNERSFGHPNMVKKPIKMQGKTVGEILKNLFKALDDTSKEIQEIENKEAGVTSKEYDRYEIQFPKWDDKAGWISSTISENKISSSKMGNVLTDPLLVGMNKPEDTSQTNGYNANDAKKPKEGDPPPSVKFKPGESVIQFDQDTNISEILTAVVRDSEYSKDLLKGLTEKKPGIPDQYGFVDYWLIRVETTNSDVINELGKKPFQKFTYIIQPYKVHYTRIPGYGRERINEKDLKIISNREYNFIYTGKNIDVLNFKLNFNNLFFEAVPVNMGNKPTSGKSDAAAPANTQATKINSKPAAVSQGNREAGQVPDPAVKILSAKIQAYGGNAAQPQEDPYQLLARTMHNAVINSQASMLTGELEILGDPFYLAGAGAGNWNPKPAKRGQTETGEANQNYGSVLITINFRNPEDINSFEKGGMMKFDSNRVPFSGVYQVTTVLSTFKNGEFKQKLDVIRMPGQVLDSDLRSSDPADRYSAENKAGSQVVPDETRAMSPEQRADSRSVETILNRGLPDSNTNFVNATGGLGGSPLLEITPASPLSKLTAGGIDLLTQTPSPSAAQLNVSSVVGTALPTDVTSNIRLNNSGLTSLSQSALKISGAAASISAAANIVKGTFSQQGLTGLIGSTLAASAIGAASKVYNQGSGIGKGATVLINPSSSIPTSPTANEIKQGLNIDSNSLSVGSISRTVTGVGTNIPSALKNVGVDSGNLINGVGGKITALTSLPADPKGIAAQVGLDPSRLSGLGGALQSKLPSQVTDLINKIPGNVNLKQAANQGLVLDYIPSSKVTNIPATPPYSRAPVAKADAEYAKTVVEKGGMTALQNLYGVNSSAKLSTNLVPGDLIASAEQSVSNSRLNPLGNLTGLTNTVDINVAKDKLGSFQTQLSGLTGQLKIPDATSLGSVTSKFSARTLGSSPLTNLVNKLNNNTGST